MFLRFLKRRKPPVEEPFGACMGPDFEHYERLAGDVFAEILPIIKEQLGHDDGYLPAMPILARSVAREWHEAEQDLRKAIEKMAYVEACASF